MRLASYLAFVALVCLIFACGDKSTISVSEDPLKGLKEQLAETPREDREAEEAALWLSGELVAPESLYQELRLAFAKLRNDLSGSEHTISSDGFVLPYQSQAICVGLTDSAVQMYRQGSYIAWDSLNQLFGITSLDSGHYLSVLKTITVNYSGRLNGDSIASYYQKLPGIEWAYAIYWGGYLSSLTPYYRGSNIAFLQWACGFDCVDIEFWDFVEHDSLFQLNGHIYCGEYWSCRFGDWWEEARNAYCIYQHIPIGGWGWCGDWPPDTL